MTEILTPEQLAEKLGKSVKWIKFCIPPKKSSWQRFLRFLRKLWS